jgi:uncharacterized tellurite resistance protein B-like protein
MTIASLGNVLKIFGGGEPSPEQHQQFVKEALLMTLARASSSDSNINPVEVSSVRRIIKQATGDDVSEADVRIAASAEIFETTSLHSALAKLSHKLNSSDRVLIASSLATVIKSDSHISEREADFFDEVARALKISPAELVGLVPER